MPTQHQEPLSDDETLFNVISHLKPFSRSGVGLVDLKLSHNIAKKSPRDFAPMYPITCVSIEIKRLYGITLAYIPIPLSATYPADLTARPVSNEQSIRGSSVAMNESREETLLL